MRILLLYLMLILSFMMMTGCSSPSGKLSRPEPVFQNVTVHDPSVIKVDQIYYVFGSHLASAKSEDLMKWTQISENAKAGNKLIPNAREEMAEALAWAQTETFWAGDVIRLNDGRYYMYYCNCRGDSPLGCLGIAVSDSVEGPYTNLGIILRSGMWGKASEDGTIYNADYHPNVVDPHVFFDKEGKLWMVYGSYSGGIFIMEMDADTGFPLPDQGYGKKLLGGYHARIEGPYILYSPHTDYYYLFLSFGGLDANGAYNIRVARSKNPDGPFLDAKGQDMIHCKGKKGQLFHDPSIQPYGTKLVGNYQFVSLDGEPASSTVGYVSPGHNSAYYNEETDQYFIFFHTRFSFRGEVHEVRVHEMFINQDGWPVVAPFRYAGESQRIFNKSELVGDYKVILHGDDISSKVKTSVPVLLSRNGRISGSMEGKWTYSKGHIELTLDGILYKGTVTEQWDTDNHSWVAGFTAMSQNGQCIWGSKAVK